MSTYSYCLLVSDMTAAEKEEDDMPRSSSRNIDGRSYLPLSNEKYNDYASGPELHILPGRDDDDDDD